MKELKKEKACGCIIIDNGKVLLVQQNEGWWGFPKGHVEEGETEIETAIREVKEETNIDIIPDETKRYEQEYMLENGILKQVVLFVAKKTSNGIKKQESEVQNIKWFDFKKAAEMITYEDTRELLLKALKENGYGEKTCLFRKNKRCIRSR